MAIDISKLTDADKGRRVMHAKGRGNPLVAELRSWYFHDDSPIAKIVYYNGEGQHPVDPAHLDFVDDNNVIIPQ